MRLKPSTALRAIAATIALAPLAQRADAQELPDSVIPIDTVRVEVARLRSGGVPLARTAYRTDVVELVDLPHPGALTVADALDGAAGVSTASQFGNPLQTDLRLRGFQAGPVVGYPQSVSVFVDGVRVNEPDASQVNFDLIPLHAIERIEVVRAPGGAFGRNTLAGAINLVTRRAGPGGGAAGAAELAGGSFETGRFQGWAAASSSSGLDYLVSGRYHRTDGWRDLSSTDLRQVYVKGGYRNAASDFALSYTFADNRVEAPGSLPSTWLAGDLPTELNGTRDPRRLQFTGFEGDWFAPRLHFFTANAAHTLASGVRLQGNAFARSNEFTQFNDNITEPNARGATDIASGGAAVQLGGGSGAGLTWSAGAEFVRNDTDILIFEESNPAFPDAGGMTESVESVEDNVGGFATLWWAPGERGSLSASIRYDWIRLPVEDRLDPENSGENRFSEVSGSIGGELSLAPGLRAYASYGRGFRAPVILEVSCADPEDPCPLPFELGADPPLDPVVADTWQGGLRYSTGGMAVEGSLFDTLVHDDLFAVVLPPSTRGYFKNLDRTRRRGAELSARVEALPGLTLEATTAWTRSTFESDALLASALLDDDDDDDHDGPGEEEDDDDDDDGDGLADGGATRVVPGNRFAMTPDFVATAAAELARSAWRVRLAGSWVGSQFFVGDEANREAFGKLDPYFLLDATVERALGRFTLFVAAENLLGLEHETFGIISPNVRGPVETPQPFLSPGLPRRFEAGLRATL